MKQVRKPTNRTRKAMRLAVPPRVVVLITLLAFSIQTYLTQTHIHWQTERQSSISQVQGLIGQDKAARGAPNERKDGYPANEDPANCPLCQELVHAGQFVTPSAAAIVLPFVSFSVIAVALPSAALIQAVTHIWRGRAPPLG